MLNNLYISTRKPQLRPVEVFPLSGEQAGSFAVRDRQGYSNVALTVSPAALQVMILMDGLHTCEDIRTQFKQEFDQELGIDTLTQMIQHLEEALLLEGDTFRNHLRKLEVQYRENPIRPMPSAKTMGITPDSGAWLDQMLADAKTPVLSRKVVGLVAPHLDYSRGAPCYGLAYNTIKDRKTPNRVIILGTNHFGMSTSIVATAKDFETPLGVSRCDTEFLKTLESDLDGPNCLRANELDHAREHSIELQVVWLQHLFGADSFKIVTALCPDISGPNGTRPCDGEGVDLARFAESLRKHIETDGEDTLIVAGADLSHIGIEFGDEHPVDETYLKEVEKQDREVLAALEACDPDRFRLCVGENDNPTRICSTGCVYTLATALPQATPNVLGYHQAHSPQAQICVTCAAIAYTR